MQRADANVILRFLLNDSDQSELAARILFENDVTVSTEVICEVVYVLSGVYNISRSDISTALLSLFSTTKCIVPGRDAVLKGIELYGISKYDFVDCILVGYVITNGDIVHTFDRSLQQFIDRVRSSSDRSKNT